MDKYHLMASESNFKSEKQITEKDFKIISFGVCQNDKNRKEHRLWPKFVYFFFKNCVGWGLKFFCSSNTMKFRIQVQNFLLILTKVFVLKFDHQVALESNFKSSNCHNFGFWDSNLIIVTSLERVHYGASFQVQ